LATGVERRCGLSESVNPDPMLSKTTICQQVVLAEVISWVSSKSF